jgi:hypothetical protein
MVNSEVDGIRKKKPCVASLARLPLPLRSAKYALNDLGRLNTREFHVETLEGVGEAVAVETKFVLVYQNLINDGKLH